MCTLFVTINPMLPEELALNLRSVCYPFWTVCDLMPGLRDCFHASVLLQDPEGAVKALELDGIEIKGKPVKVFSSLEEWDQHIASFKDAQKQSQENVKEEEGEGDGEADGDMEQDDGANGDAEMEDGQVSNLFCVTLCYI